MEPSALQLILKNKELNKINAISEFNLLKRNQVLHKNVAAMFSFIDFDNIGQLLFHLRDNLPIQRCECKEQLKFHKFDKGYFKTCGKKECVSTIRINSIKDTTREKWGVEHTSQLDSVKAKHKETMLDKYGCSHNFSGILREEQYKKNMEKWGVKHPLEREESQLKRNLTMLSKYHSLDVLHFDSTKKTNRERYGEENPMKSKKISEKVSNSLKRTFSNRQISKLERWDINLVEYMGETQYYTIFCNVCNTSSVVAGSSMNSRLRSDSNPCVICNPYIKTYVSGQEIEVYDFIVSLGEKVINSAKTIVKKHELDIFLPDRNIGFEFNGLYWHSELYREPDYHMKKTEKFLRSGIKIYHIWEDDWLNKKDLVKSRILNLLGKAKKIGARECTIRSIDHKLGKEFFEKNHLDGNFSAKYYVGAFYKEQMVGCMSFSRSRFDKSDAWEMIRFATCEYSIAGLCSKFLSFFRKNIDNKTNIVTYAKTDWTPDPDQSVYKKCGFKLSGHTSPSLYWSINGMRFHRLNFTKKKLVERGKDKKLKAVEIMHNDGYYRIWDSGNWKFILD
jgi:hypothetical protein